jgi:3-oxoacyl-[acyl-carrier protein] reductase
MISYASADDAAESLVAAERREGREVTLLKGSVTDATYVKHLVAETKARYGRIDILVNNAGVVSDKWMMMMTDAEWSRVIDVNLNGTFLCCREAIKSMISQRSGRIINITSVSGVVGRAGQTNYAASKGGIIGLTKSLAREVARFAILVNAIAPGFIQTDMIAGISQEEMERALTEVPVKRVGNPADVANAALYLASELANYTTGHVLHVDGGQAM